MKSKYIVRNLLLLIAVMVIISACKKQQDDYLNVKRNLNDVVPTTLEDMQAILNDEYSFNRNFPTGGYAGTDNLYVVDAKVGSLNQVVRNAYLWKPDIYQGLGGSLASDWDRPYQTIEICNIALDGLAKIKMDNSNQSQYEAVKGQALFYRSFMFYALSQLFCKTYDSTTANNDLGIVLQLTSDVNVKSTRATVRETYDRMVTDLKEALTLLPVTPQYQTRPSKPAANALLAKIYLVMGDYQKALSYATASLQDFNTLLDFNNAILVRPTVTLPFPAYHKNPEICFYGTSEAGPGISLVTATVNKANVDSTLYRSYDPTDLRKTVFYKDQGSGNVYFRGSYGGSFYPFAGIATNEVLLIRAECYARLNDKANALADLNTLLRNRYQTGTYTDLSISDPATLLNKVLLERRKELPFTGQIRWEDLRRLNKDPQFAITLKRISNGTQYTLPPNDPRYVFPIPPAEIQLSGLPQNPR